ncbi:site-specific DNA-methyltransferase [Francisella philomiragia]|uniref:site-specific DNA-methyltransferase n=1 Tax=Francisella philomiragia TaxID=28110 RepID=UPI001B8C5455|nr:site-specific DNA-methyltransferase [Francisella philomiragia]QUE32184.1 site-specific DNA-methyltransferase [Francisella philomiragia]
MQKQQLDGKSMDIVESNIDKLKQLFPDVFSQGQINFEKLQAVLGERICEDEEHYKFTWHGKKKAEHEATKTRSTGTLRPVKADSKHWDSTNNIFIEGDNLEVLKLLQKSYHNKIKMIYIDPPYNTGKDFVYKDNYKDNLTNYKKITGQVDGEGMVISSNTDKSGRYHTDWLNMMYPRLKLARNLLKDDGVIFISIDDNEQANLKKMCDEIFGEDNFVGNITRKQSSGSKNDTGYNKIVSTTDSILCYARMNFVFYPIRVKPNKKYQYSDEYGRYDVRALEMQGGDDTLPLRNKMGYSIYYHAEIKRVVIKHDYDLKNQNVYEYPCENLLSQGYVCYRPRKRGNEYGIWRWGKETFLDKYASGDVYFDNTRVYLKEREVEYIDKYPDSLVVDYLNTHGTNELKHIFNGRKIFSFPKPVSLIRYLTSLSVSKNDIILDFFAGSGTTGDAVMQLNAEDGGNRKYICVQLDEPICEKDNKEAFNFCTDPKNNFKPVISSITKERLRRAGDKIITDAKKELTDLLAKSRPDAEKIKTAQEKLARLLGNSPSVKGWIAKQDGVVLEGDHPTDKVGTPPAEGNKVDISLSDLTHDNTTGLDIGFKAFKLDTSNIKPWDGKNISNFGDLVEDIENIKQSRSTDDVLYEILLKLGLDLAVPITETNCNGSTLYNIGMGALLICLDKANDAVISEIIKIKNETENTELEVVFKDSVFESDVAKTNYSQQLESAGIKTVKVL